MYKEGIAREDRHSLFRQTDQQICLNSTYVGVHICLFLTIYFRISRKLESIANFHLDLGKIQTDLYPHGLLRKVAERYLTAFMQEILVFSVIMCHFQVRVGILHFCSVVS